MGWNDRCNVSELKGKTLVKVDADNYQILFTCTDGERFIMYHEPECCESVLIDDICGELDDLVGSEIMLAEQVSSIEPPEKPKNGDAWEDESETWTFYKISTLKGSVTIRWYGASNGCYSEDVDFERMNSEA